MGWVAEEGCLPGADPSALSERARKRGADQLGTMGSGNHFVELQPDNVREYRSPDYLLLRCQLIITDRTIEIEPIIGSRGSADHSESVAHRLTGDPLRLLEQGA